MSETLGVVIVVILAAMVLYHFAEAIGLSVAGFAVAVSRWVQRVVFGIDRPRAGAESLTGRDAVVESAFSLADEIGSSEGYVVVDGDRWRARSVSGTDFYSVGERVSVIGREGLVLLVDHLRAK